MATLAPRLGLKKLVPGAETDWGFRLNETMDILDGAALAANIGGASGIGKDFAGTLSKLRNVTAENLTPDVPEEL